MTISESLKGYISMWRRDKGPLASGEFSVKPEVLEAFLTLPRDSYGNIKLNIVIFDEGAKNSKAPTLKGYVHKSSFVPGGNASKTADQPYRKVAPATTAQYDSRPIDEFEDVPL
jgi:hypothetical protein